METIPGDLRAAGRSIEIVRDDPLRLFLPHLYDHVHWWVFTPYRIRGIFFQSHDPVDHHRLHVYSRGELFSILTAYKTKARGAFEESRVQALHCYLATCRDNRTRVCSLCRRCRATSERHCVPGGIHRNHHRLCDSGLRYVAICNAPRFTTAHV